MERRLAAILTADVVGYSRLMDEDEAGTHVRLEGLKAETLDPLISQHHGRIVKLMGDGFLIEFSSAVNAVECAIAWQNNVEARTNLVAEDRAIRFRIGINVGDVIVKGDDLFGEGVNVSARLEGLAEAGDILVSRSVTEHVKGKITPEFEDMGERKLKNIAEPVQVFRVVAQPDKQIPSASVRKSVTGNKVWVAVACIATLIFISGTVLWWQQPVALEEPAVIERMAFKLPDKPSIAVLPFNNLSEDASQEYFVDGITEDLITDLSKVSGLFVIARNSTFVYKGTPVKIRKVAEDLGVRYVLEGSVRRVGERLRLNAQLIDATTGGHVWADRFDGDVTEIFAVQDAFVMKIVNALAVKLLSDEKSEIAKKVTNDLDAREAFQKGWELYLHLNEEDNEKSVRYFKKAIELDPEFGRAYAALALVYWNSSRYGWTVMGVDSMNAIFGNFLPLLKEIEKYPSALGHVAVAMSHLYRGRPNQARIEAARAIALQPSDPEAHIVMAWAMITAGNPVEGLNFVQAAIRLNPRYPSHYVIANGIAHYGIGNLKKAARVFEEGIERYPKAVELNPLAASIFAQLDRRQEARATIVAWRSETEQSVLNKMPDGFIFPIKWAHEHRQVRERLMDGLRVAVLPLDVTVASLIGDLKTTTWIARANVALTLGWFGPAAAPAVPDLIEALGDEDRSVRENVIITLGKIGSAAKKAVPALKAIEDEEFLGFYATDALKEITRN